MNPLLILKLGDTFPELAARHGDFEDWVAERTGWSVEIVKKPAGGFKTDERS